MVDRNLLLWKISELEEYPAGLEGLKRTPQEDYFQNWKIQKARERTLQIAIKTCVDIASHIIADEGWLVPG